MSGGYGPVVVTGCLPPVFEVAVTPFHACPEIFYNGQQSATCGIGQAPQTFICPAGKFFSLISQDDADTQARAYAQALATANCGHAIPVVSSFTTTIPAASVFSYQIVATNNPTSYGATGLPAGLAINTTTGVISGTIISGATATYTIPISATNLDGAGNGTLTIKVKAAIAFTSAGSGTPFTTAQISLDGGSFTSIPANFTAFSQVKIRITRAAYSGGFSSLNFGMPGGIVFLSGSVLATQTTVNSTGTVIDNTMSNSAPPIIVVSANPDTSTTGNKSISTDVTGFSTSPGNGSLACFIQNGGDCTNTQWDVTLNF